MRDWYLSLAPREQVFVAAGAGIVVVSLLWAFIWLPLDRGHRSAEQSVAAWQQSLDELRPLTARVLASESNTQRRVNVGLNPVVVVDQTLRARGLDRSLRRSQPSGNGIRVEFENVAFDDLVLWLGDLSAQHAMQVMAGSVSVAPRSEPGRVTATLTLERSL